MRGVGGQGAELARAYHDEVVAPLLRQAFGDLPHAAGLLGPGSEVLGLDDARSTDHDWGPRLTVLVPADRVGEVDAVLARALPPEFGGLPTSYPTTSDPHPRHRVEVTSVGELARARLGVGADGPAEAGQWLALTGQAVLELTAGPVFTDTAGDLTLLRERLTWYPDDLWRYVLAVDWVRLGQHLPLLGRAGSRGDRQGARLIAARVADAAVHLGFLLGRTWPPYPKWRGTAFAALPFGVAVGDLLDAALTAGDWQEGEEFLCRALTRLHEVQLGLGLPGGRGAVVPFHDRPFRGVDDAVAGALLASIDDRRVRTLPRGVGSVEQWVDSVDVLVDPARRNAAAAALLPAVRGGS